MRFIGFELMTGRSLTILPDSSFSISILWNYNRLTSSLGKDTYNRHSFLLPQRIITATGRFNHSSDKKLSLMSSVEGSPCHFIPCPKTVPESVQLELTVPLTVSLSPVYRATSLRFRQKNNKNNIEESTLYLDPSSIEEKQKNRYIIDLSYLIPKHFLLNEDRS